MRHGGSIGGREGGAEREEEEPPPPTLPPTQAQADAPYRITCEVGGQTAAADRTAFESWCVRAAGSGHQSNKWNRFVFPSFLFFFF